MDKEAQKKVALVLWYVDTSDFLSEQPSQRHLDTAEEVLKTLEQLGYRKPLGEPPLVEALPLAQAQRETDIKWYGDKL